MKKRSSFIFVILLIFASLNLVVALSPDGANISVIRTEMTNTTHLPTSNEAYAGNVTEINIFGLSPTQSWQGYFGNITGVIQLTDAVNNVMYNWSVASPQGEIYATTNNSLLWSNLQCFNFTANGTYNSEVGVGGTTNLYGKNLTLLESQMGIDEIDVDGVDETFTFYQGNGHGLFYTSNLMFSAGECRNTRIFGNGGSQSTGQFEEALLYEPSTTSVVFASLIEDNMLGFDNLQHDFEMLVLDDGHGTNTVPTTYYFYVELE